MNMSSSALIAILSEQVGHHTAWVHLVPAGTFSGIDGRGPYKLTNADAVIAATREKAGRRKMVIDYEHQSINSQANGRPAPAAGWIVGMEARADGIWGLVEWTETAAAHVSKREYHYISPVFRHAKDGTVLAIENAALTNLPNLDQLVALNRAGATMENDLASKLAAAAKLLGLPETAGQAEIVGRFNELFTLASDIASLTGEPLIASHSANPDPAKFVPIGDFERAVADGNKLRQGVTESVAKHRVEDDMRTGNLAPFLKDWAISLCVQNMPAYDSFMERVGPAFANILTPHRIGALPPATTGKDTLSADELAVCSRLGLSAEEYTKAR
jgi:phage I-like protein